MATNKTIPVEITAPDGKERIQVTPEVFEAIEETAAILNSPDLAKAVDEGKKQLEAGKVQSWDSLKANLGL